MTPNSLLFLIAIIANFMCCASRIDDVDLSTQTLRPDIFIIGVQKGGTTSLHDILLGNGEICGFGSKEKHFFDHNSLWFRGYDNYLSSFKKCTPGKITIDATPMFAVESVPKRIKETYSKSSLSKLKFILILREPISREFSAFQHRLRACSELIKETVPVYDRAFANYSCSLVHRNVSSVNTSLAFDAIAFREYYQLGHLKIRDSDYIRHLNNWLSVIKRQQLFILNMKTMILNSSDTMQRLQVFLGIKTGWGSNVRFPRDNNSSDMNAILDCETFDELKALYWYQNYTENLFAIVNSPLKPPSEPPFPEFEDTRIKCIETRPNFTKRTPAPNTASHGRGSMSEVFVKQNYEENHITTMPSTMPEGSSVYRHPDYFIIGVQKGSSSSLYNWLTQHPQICKDGLTEKHFFNTQKWRLGASFYNSLFSSCANDSLTIDATPVFGIESVPARLHSSYTPASLQRMKFILILREPITREFSYYQHRLHSCFEYTQGTIEEYDRQFARVSCQMIRATFGSTATFSPVTFREYNARGFLNKRDSEYVTHLRNWLSVVHRSQLLILNMDTLLVNETDTMNRLMKFLGLRVSSNNINTSLLNDNNSSLVEATLDCETYDKLKSYYDIHNAGLLALINSPDKPPMEPEFIPFQDYRYKCVDLSLEPIPGQLQESNTATNQTIVPPDSFLLRVGMVGTSMVLDTFKTTPQICTASPDKYFFNSNESWGKGLSHYVRSFFACEAISLTLDSSVLVTSPEASIRVQRAYPPSVLAQKKFILILEDPALRDFMWFEYKWSACSDLFRNRKQQSTGDTGKIGTVFSMWSCNSVMLSYNEDSNFAPLEFRDYFLQKRIELLDGHYSDYLKTWLQIIGRHQLFIISAEAIITDPSDSMKRIGDFLGLQGGWDRNVSYPSGSLLVRTHGLAQLDCATYDNLTLYYNSVNGDLEKIVNDARKPKSQPLFTSFNRTHVLPCVGPRMDSATAWNSTTRTAVQKVDSYLTSVPVVPASMRHKNSEPDVSKAKSPTVFLLGSFIDGIRAFVDLLAAQPNICYVGSTLEALPPVSPLWYKDINEEWRYASCTHSQTILHATPVFSDPHAPAHFKELYPGESLLNKKFLLVLEDPAVREFTWFKRKLAACAKYVRMLGAGSSSFGRRCCGEVLHDNRPGTNGGIKTLTFEQYYNLNHWNQSEGEYRLHIQKWLQVIPRSQLFVTTVNELRENATDILARISDFLQIPLELNRLASTFTLVDSEQGQFTATLDCSTYGKLSAIFYSKNDGLDAIINSDDRPRSQPLHYGFGTSIQATCVIDQHEASSRSRSHGRSRPSDSSIPLLFSVYQSSSRTRHSVKSHNRTSLPHVNIGPTDAVNASAQLPSAQLPLIGLNNTNDTTSQHNLLSIPDVFVLGVQLSGASALVDLLLKRFGACSKGPPEKHFFNHPEQFNKGFQAYVRMYKGCSSASLLLDSTPMLNVGGAINRVANTYSPAYLSEKKFIVVLEDPVLRDVAWFEHKLSECAKYIKLHKSKKAGATFAKACCSSVFPSFNDNTAEFRPLTFEDYYLGGKIIMDDNHYKDQIENWLAVVARRQLFIINSELLHRNASLVLNGLVNFLGLKASNFKNSASSATFSKSLDPFRIQAKTDCWTLEQLHHYYSDANEGLAGIINSPDRPPSQPLFSDFRAFAYCSKLKN